jgi:DNA-binding MarR family transcriptional regulator
MEMTQLGISRVLGIRRNHAGIELNRLVLEGYVEVRSDWVKGEKGKRQVYKLTPAGRDLAEILAETSGIDLGAKSVNCEDTQLSWLMKMELLMNENRPRAPTRPPMRTQSPPE